MKSYQFLDSNERGIACVPANNQDEAVEKCSHLGVTFETDFYSFEDEE